MAKLYFYYAAMNAGKSTALLQAAYNYQERGMQVLLFTPEIDHRQQKGVIASRIGLQAEAQTFDQQFDFYQALREQQAIQCMLIDEAQFLTKVQVNALCRIVDELNIPVMTYGLRSDFRGEPFEGSQYLLIFADHLAEIKTVCFCGKKASMNARLNDSGQATIVGEQVLIGGNERYVSFCRKHYYEKINALR